MQREKPWLFTKLSTPRNIITCHGLFFISTYVCALLVSTTFDRSLAPYLFSFLHLPTSSITSILLQNFFIFVFYFLFLVFILLFLTFTLFPSTYVRTYLQSIQTIFYFLFLFYTYHCFSRLYLLL